MSRETFITLVYIFLLMRGSKKKPLLIRDLRDDIFRIYSSSYHVNDFIYRFRSFYINSSDIDYISLSRKFILFLEKNIKLLS